MNTRPGNTLTGTAIVATLAASMLAGLCDSGAQATQPMVGVGDTVTNSSASDVGGPKGRSTSVAKKADDGVGARPKRRSAPTGEAAAVARLSTVVVTGTSIRGIAPIGMAPIEVGSEDIERVGADTVTQLLRTVPQVAQFNQTPVPQAANFVGMVTPTSLRLGFGIDATLILVNGHRMVAAGTTEAQAELSNIPLAAIDRIEVLPNGASAIYGADAVAGVINLITRQNFDGSETDVSLGTADNFDQWNVNQLFGRSWSGGSIMIAGELTGNTNLDGRDRPFNTNVGTLYGLSPSCGVATVGPSVPGCDEPQIGGDLVPQDNRGSVFATLRQQLTQATRLTVDALLSKDWMRTNIVTPPFPPAVFSASNPFNTSGTDEVVYYRPITEFGPTLHQESSITQGDITVRLDTSLARGWENSSFLYSGRTWNFFQGLGGTSPSALNNSAYEQAMAADTPQTAFDPFGHQTSPQVLDGILDAVDRADTAQTLTQVQSSFDGPVVKLPGGSLRLSVGLGFQREAETGSQRIGNNQSILSSGATGPLSLGFADASRSIGSAFAELAIPVVGARNALPLVQSLQVSAAGRYDHYSDFGGTTNPKLGVTWQPVQSLQLLGSWGKAYQAPSLGDTEAGAIDSRIVPYFTPTVYGPLPFSPLLAQYFGTPGLVVAGGSHGLKPQTAETYSGGFDFRPSFVPGLHAHADYYDIKFRNFIAIPFPVYGIPGLSKYGILAPMGPGGSIIPFTPGSPEVTALTASLPVEGGALPSDIYWISLLQRVNLASKTQDGVDFDVSQSVPVGNGTITGSIAGNYIIDDRQSAYDGAPYVDTGISHALLYSAFLEYQRDGFTLSVTRDSEKIPNVLVTMPAEEINLLNFASSYQIPEDGAVLGGVQLSIHIDNAMNERPPFLTTLPGGGANVLPIGRVVTFGATKRW